MDDLVLMFDQKPEPSDEQIKAAAALHGLTNWRVSAVTKHYNWDSATYKWKVEIRKEPDGNQE